MNQQALQLEKSITRPKVFAFSQAGYGRPGLNMLSTEFDTYYLAGIGLKWNIYDWGSLSNKKKITALQNDNLDLQILNLNRTIDIALENQLADIENYKNAVKNDQEIIELRKQVVESSKTQLENGTLTATQYLTEANAELLAKIQLENHKILLAQSFINYRLIKGDI
ncbi:MAG: TolC family protein [Bacteroidales bacterium]|nr:TolC family protein [Bacteroidales bacterium]